MYNKEVLITIEILFPDCRAFHCTLLYHTYTYSFTSLFYSIHSHVVTMFMASHSARFLCVHLRVHNKILLRVKKFISIISSGFRVCEGSCGILFRFVCKNSNKISMPTIKINILTYEIYLNKTKIYSSRYRKLFAVNFFASKRKKKIINSNQSQILLSQICRLHFSYSGLINFDRSVKSSLRVNSI